ncbi:Histone deacetylase HDT1 [Morus notabilis]|uniref:Histone deacetylase HDT1 n=1 Tax=Morus notabilis TaxID=981085 RepID=W9RRE3_9ROSA|nr:Histone deacetylase HDT1 [Morus notabilis]
MEFWGVEVKSGESFVVQEEYETILHLSLACLGEVKKDKGSEPVHLFAKVDDKKFVIGILSSEKFPQISFDLVFEKDFELSHNWKNGNEYSDSEDEIAPVPIELGQSSLQAKPEEKNVDVNKDVKSDQKAQVKSEEESSDDDDESEDEDDSEDEETDGSEEEEENKVDISKKRPAEASKKTSGGDKKAKFQTPEKAVAKTSGNKVGGHTATPHPAKQAGKTAAKNEQQPKQQAPKAGGAFQCKSCNRSFGSDIALQSHTKAKHATAK